MPERRKRIGPRHLARARNSEYRRSVLAFVGPTIDWIIRGVLTVVGGILWLVGAKSGANE